MLRTSPPPLWPGPAVDEPAPTSRRHSPLRHADAGAWPIVAAGAFAFIVAHLVLARGMAAPIIHPDELGYLDNARFLAHGGLRPETEYYPGISLLFVPLWWVLHNPLTIWRGALVINCVLAGGAAIVTWLLCGRLAGDPSGRRRLAVTAVISLYPPLMVYGDLALAECLFVLVFGVVVLLAGRAFAGGAPRWWASLGLASGALVAVHPRGLAVVVAVVIMGAVVWWGRRDRLTAAALAAGLTVSLAGTRLLVTATRGASPNGLAAYRPDGIITKSLSAHGMVSLLWEVGGQMFYLSVATVGLLPLGLFLGLRSMLAVARGERGQRHLTRAFAALSFLGVWVLSSLFMNLGTRTDKLIYGRYNEGAIIPLLVIALVELILVPRGRWSFGGLRASMRWALIGSATTVVTAAMVRFGHTAAALHASLNPVNVLGIYPLMRRLGGLDVAPIAAIGIGVLLIMALANWRSPSLVLLLTAGFFVATTVDIQSAYLTPGSRDRARHTVIAHTLERAAAQFGLQHDCIAFDPTLNSDFDYFALRFLLPGRQFRWFDPATGEQACGPLVVSGDPAFPTYFLGPEASRPRLVTFENDNGEQLWALAGPVRDRMDEAGWLLPDPTPGALPEVARHTSLGIDGAPRGGLSLRSGATKRVRLRATHDTAGSPWPSAAGLRQGDLAVRLVVRWFHAGEQPGVSDLQTAVLAQNTIDLNHTLLPGETNAFPVSLTARATGENGAKSPLPPGRYTVSFTVYQESAPPFVGGETTLDVTVRSS